MSEVQFEMFNKFLFFVSSLCIEAHVLALVARGIISNFYHLRNCFSVCVLLVLLQLKLVVKRKTEMLEKIIGKITETAAYKAFRKKRKKFLDSISPVCSILCLKTTNREKAIALRNEIS